MALSWRDAVGTLLVAVAIGATLSVVYGWSWPLIGDARAGAIALFVLSYPSCLVAQAPRRMREAIERVTRWSRYLVAGTVLGALTALLIVAAVILNSVAVLVAAMVFMVGVWLVTTVDHMVRAGGRPMTARA